MAWSTSDLADHYRRLGKPNPVGDACGDGPKRSKFGSVKTVVDGITFDSGHEANDYRALKIAADAGQISGLQLQPRFLLQESFVGAQGKRHRAITYVADFSFMQDGRHVVVDSKGFRTAVYRQKIKMFLKAYPDIEFRESRVKR